MTNNKLTNSVAAVALMAAMATTPTLAASDKDIQTLRDEIRKLEAKVNQLQGAKSTSDTTQAGRKSTGATGAMKKPTTSAFNPAVGLIFNGQYSQYSGDDAGIAGFATGHGAERADEGFSPDHTELNFSANVDSKFYASATAALAPHDGETEVELEEAYVQTLPGLGLPSGMDVKFGRAFWKLGYLNEHHNHNDDFADRPLPNRAFLSGTYNDDGVQVSYVLPTDFYSEIGGGVYRGDDFPFGEASGDGFGAWSAYARIGGDIGLNQSWRLGGSVLSGKSDGGRTTTGGGHGHADAGAADPHGHDEDAGAEPEGLTYVGDTDIFIADLRYTFAPSGNARDRELILQAEYFWRNEDGTYTDAALVHEHEEVEEHNMMNPTMLEEVPPSGTSAYDDDTHGWYAQAIYKFAPKWRMGLRYSQLYSADAPENLHGSAIDAEGHDPRTYSVMFDWSNSEFSRLRLQYNREELSENEGDNQILLQYVMSIGAHAAHSF